MPICPPRPPPTHAYAHAHSCSAYCIASTTTLTALSLSPLPLRCLGCTDGVVRCCTAPVPPSCSWIYCAVYWREGRLPNPAAMSNVQNIMGIMFSSSNFLGKSLLLAGGRALGVCTGFRLRASGLSRAGRGPRAGAAEPCCTGRAASAATAMISCSAVTAIGATLRLPSGQLICRPCCVMTSWSMQA